MSDGGTTGGSFQYEGPEKEEVAGPPSAERKLQWNEPPPEQVAAGARKMLRQIWDMTHRSDSAPRGAFDEWAGVLESVFTLSDILPDGELADTLADVESGDVGEDALDQVQLEGDPATVELIVGAAVERLTSGEHAAAFISGPVARAVERLELEGRATRENLCDIVLRALGPLRGTVPAADLSRDAARYLLGQPEAERGTGYYATLTGLASNLLAPIPRQRDRVLVGGLLYHVGVRALWQLAASDRLDLRDRAVRGMLMASAGNLAVLLAEWQQQEMGRGPNAAERTVDVLRALKRLTSAVAPPAQLDEQRAVELLSTLALPSDRPVELATVINDAANPANTWGADTVDVSHLLAASAVFAVAAGVPQQVPARLYNAAISLDRAGRELPHIAGQLVLNALGFEWSAQGGQTLPEVLLLGDGLDCIVNFLATMQQYRDVGADLRELTPVAALMAAASRSVAMPWSDARVARVMRSADRLGLPAADPPELLELAAAVAHTVESLLTPAASAHARAVAQDAELRAAVVVHDVFGRLRPRPGGDWSDEMLRMLAMLVDGRLNPRAQFVESYGRFAEPVEDEVGFGPLVAAESVSIEEWQALAAEVLTPLPVLAPLLRRVSAEYIAT